MASRVEELKQSFLSTAKEEHITYDWDAGHCYSEVHNEFTDSLDKLDIPEADRDRMVDFINEWKDDHERTLYCVPELINKLAGKNVVVSCDNQCAERSGSSEYDIESTPEYLQGFADLVKYVDQQNGNDHEYKWYHIDLLEQYLEKKKFDEKLETVLTGEDK